MEKVAIQGIAGSYHEIAARAYFRDHEYEIIGCDNFDDLFAYLKKSDTHTYGLMAIENTIAGNLLHNHELLRKSSMRIIGEYRLRISHSLCALPGERLEDIREVHSHPIALMQCEQFLEQLNAAKRVERSDTALSAKEIFDKQQTGVAAICSQKAAAAYGLHCLAQGIETNKRNFTRFLVLAHDQVLLHEKTCNKASWVFSVSHHIGSLSKVLTILSFYNINLTKIQSMPILGKEWQYRFYIDVTYSQYDNYTHALQAILPFTEEFKILGEYAEALENENGKSESAN